MHANRLALLLSLALLSPATAQAQTQSQPQSQTRSPATPPETPQLSPSAAYTEALHPLEITRHNIANWSDTELAAMNVAIANAKAGCAARDPAGYTGADLVDLARLCSLGQQWNAVVAAASRYIALPDHTLPRLTDAYVAQTEAQLRLKQEPAALQSALAMLPAVPYTPDVGDCVDEALGYMRFVHTGDALTLAGARQPLLLATLRTAGPVSPAAAEPPSAAAPQTAPQTAPNPSSWTANALYAQGLLLPALQQLATKATDASASVAALETALPTKLSPDDSLLIARSRQRYALLGKPLTGIAPKVSLSMPYDQPPTLPIRGAITAMLLFPDWCAGCIRLGPQLPPTVFTVEGHSAYVFALLAETVPPRQPDPKLTNAAFNPAYAAAMLAETPTVTVPVETLNRFKADDFPLLLLTDSAGVLRVLQPVGARDLQPGGDVDAAIALVGVNFSKRSAPPAPVSAPKPASGRH